MGLRLWEIPFKAAGKNSKRAVDTRSLTRDVSPNEYLRSRAATLEVASSARIALERGCERDIWINDMELRTSGWWSCTTFVQYIIIYNLTSLQSIDAALPWLVQVLCLFRALLARPQPQYSPS